ncbi:MAG TPA: phage terminase large subunit, partial [Elusimicrobiales bacterium]|nr:phage terminase large subunit [Elusimicrobiales bacterium]
LTERQTQALKLFATPTPNILLFGGSQSGKTFIGLQTITLRAILAAGSRHLVFRKIFKDVKASVCLDTFPTMMKLRFPDLFKRVVMNKSDWYCTFPNGSEIWFGGLDDNETSEKILGKRFATIYANECSEIGYNSFLKASSRLSQKVYKKDGQALVNKAICDCNPVSKRHWVHRVFVDKVEPKSGKPLPNKDDYKYMLMNPVDNKENLPDGYIENRLSNLPERERNRFLLGLWSTEIEGAIFATDIGLAEQRGQFTKAEYNPEFPVFTGWDIGVYTAIWFAQFIKDKIYLIDFCQDKFKGLGEWATFLKEKPYKYEKHFVPFDMKNYDWQSGKTRREAAINDYKLDIKILGNYKIDDRIEAVRTIFPKLIFDNEKCYEGIEFLSDYKVEFNTRLGKYDEKPFKDESSHCADALQQLALGYKESYYKPKIESKLKSDSLTFNKILQDRIKRNESNYRKL